MSKFSAIIMLAALLALGGCGGATPDCGAGETLDLVKEVWLKNRIIPAYRQRLAAIREREWEIVYLPAWQEKMAAAVGNWDEEDAVELAWGQEGEKFGKETEDMIDEKVIEDQDKFNVELEFVTMTRYDEALDAYQCSAQVKASLSGAGLWRGGVDFTRHEAKIAYTVKGDATGSGKFFVELFDA